MSFAGAFALYMETTRRRRWSLIKRDFTTNYLKEGGPEFTQSNSRSKHRHRGVWQKRFWEHQIRDERDLQTHIDYIHYNPIKHGLVKALDDWPWSTYHKYVESGRYGKVDLEEMQESVNNLFAHPTDYQLPTTGQPHLALRNPSKWR